MIDWAVLVLASGAAGCVDAIVGGGGLILVPALFATYPNAAPATLMGTNKGGAVWGTAWAAFHYAQRVKLPWASLGPALLAALVGSALGAALLTQIGPTGLRQALPLVLLLIFAYTLYRKDLGRSHAPHHAGRAETLRASAIGLGIGVYDGFFGPGTGSFFVFLFVRALGWDFLHASAAAKLLNAGTNLAALLLFGWTGHVWWSLALTLGAANVVGSLLGTRLALRHGAGFVRSAFIVVVGTLILKTAYSAYFAGG
jgi:uncharacterized membrane protein YfcA